MDNNWLKVSEAVMASGLSLSTVRRFVSKYKNDVDTVIRENTSTGHFHYLVNMEKLTSSHMHELNRSEHAHQGIHKDRSAIDRAHPADVLRRPPLKF